MFRGDALGSPSTATSSLELDHLHESLSTSSETDDDEYSQDTSEYELDIDDLISELWYELQQIVESFNLRNNSENVSPSFTDLEDADIEIIRLIDLLALLW
jgi:hypothetical protein